MHERASWDNLGKSLAGGAACLVLGWFAFVRGVNVPLLWMVDLGFHELGHLLTRWAPEVVMAMMGSITQVLVPVGLGVYFLWWRRDVLGGALCLAWASTSAQNASVYIADAPYQRLQLIGGFHDWAFVLGPEHLNMLDRAALIAACVKGFGVVLWLAAFALCCAGPWVEPKWRRQRGTDIAFESPVFDANRAGRFVG
ncbi:MAG TPA: hypothetical protein VGH10_13400 [Actinomycetota bacterium]